MLRVYDITGFRHYRILSLEKVGCSPEADKKKTGLPTRESRVKTLSLHHDNPFFKDFTVTQPRKIAVLGSTGSIGTQTLDIIDANPDLFKAQVLTAHSNADLLVRQAMRYKPALAVIADGSLYGRVKEALSPFGIEVQAGDDAVACAAERSDVDTVLTATVGYSGLTPTIHAIRAGKHIALANKETLVVAGELITRLLSRSKSTIHPVDSEHSAIYQCLQGEDPKNVEELIITASGGPFRHTPSQRLRYVTVADALNHPNWSMGAKITIDSATMINKAFEIIEARWLFGIPAEHIKAVVHPQSIVHSMVRFRDGAIKAQLGIPDMHLPISYALGRACRLHSAEPPLTLSQYASLTFEAPDTDRFPCLGFAREALMRGGTAACVINAANEIAVDAFLHGRIRFTDFYPIISKTLDMVNFIADPTYDDYVITNAEARRVAALLISKSQKN